MNGESREEVTDRRSSECDKEDQDITSTEESAWIQEVIAIIADISSCVSKASLSDKLTCRDVKASCAYFNVETLESGQICVRVSAEGFSVVGNKFDDKSLEDDPQVPVYETPYALLQSMSPSYVQKFSAELSARLKDLSDQVS